MEEKEEIIKCSCGCCMVRVSKDECMTYLATYNYGMGKPSLKYRLKAAIKVLFKGTYYADEVVLTQEEANKLSIFLYE